MAPSPGPTNYTVASAVLACQTADTGWVPAQTCTPGTNATTGQTIDCQTVSTGPTPVASCTQAAAASGNNWTQTTCNLVTIMASQGVASCTASGPTSANGYVGTSCTTNKVGPVTTTGCVPATASSSNNWTTTTCSSSAGTFDTLADVAEYYYVTDLRTSTLGNQFSGATGAVNGTDISNNNVPSSNLDTAPWQHMTTFTLGLGARGKMVFDPSYETATSGDFYSVWQGSTANPGVGVCSWQALNTTCNWPIPGKDKPENIDDLWHAAVNGRGTYFSAANPSDLSIALTGALAGVSARKGSAAAATTSTAFITQGDNFLFHSSFVSLDWTGELTRQQINLATAKLSAADWSAQTQLDAVTPYTNRTVYFFKSSTASKLGLFSWGNLSAAQQSYFALSNLGSLAQFCVTGATCLSSTDQSAAAGSPLVEYIKGDRSNEGALADNTKYYRARKHLLGDIVDSESFYVKGALSSYSDTGYSTYQSSMLSRTPMLYVGANDGMLHAINAADGNEAWAYIPSAVMSNLYKLADKGYGLKHQFYVDGSPQAADIYTGTEWKTILVGGLNNGGQGYYALDVTDPANPKGLWEFSDPNLGYTYGNPMVVKLKDGTWVVLLTSGYNNADGLGHLFVVNAATGQLINDIATSAGTPTNPSGLSRIDLAVASPGVDATVQVVYGGDYQGNLWRFDVNGDLGASGYDAQLLVTLQDGAGNAQPITARPLLSKVGTTLVVYVGTGSFLGVSDQTNTSQQSFYAIKDTFPAGTTPSVAIYGNPRSSSTFVQQTITLTPCPVNTPASLCSAGTDAAISSSSPVDWGTKNGWYFDFPHTGERDNTDPAILMGTLVFTSNIPKSDACSVGGDSWVYMLDYKTGGAVNAAAGTGVVGRKFGNELASRPIVITFGSADGGGGGGGGGGHICVQGSAGNDPECAPLPPNWVPGTPRRAAWRQLISE